MEAGDLAHVGEEQLDVFVDLRALPTVARLERSTFFRVTHRRRDALDALGLGLVELLEELPRVGREALDVPPLALGVERVEGQARLAAAADAAEGDKSAAATT